MPASAPACAVQQIRRRAGPAGVATKEPPERVRVSETRASRVRTEIATHLAAALLLATCSKRMATEIATHLAAALLLATGSKTLLRVLPFPAPLLWAASLGGAPCATLLWAVSLRCVVTRLGSGHRSRILRAREGVAQGATKGDAPWIGPSTTWRCLFCD